MIFTPNNETAVQQVKLEQLEKRISFLTKSLEQTKHTIAGFATSADLQQLQLQLSVLAQFETDLQQLSAQIIGLNQALDIFEQNQVSLSQINLLLTELENSLQQFALTLIAESAAPMPQIIISRWS